MEKAVEEFLDADKINNDIYSKKEKMLFIWKSLKEYPDLRDVFFDSVKYEALDYKNKLIYEYFKDVKKDWNDLRDVIKNVCIMSGVDWTKKISKYDWIIPNKKKALEIIREKFLF